MHVKQKLTFTHVFISKSKLNNDILQPEIKEFYSWNTMVTPFWLCKTAKQYSEPLFGSLR